MRRTLLAVLTIVFATSTPLQCVCQNGREDAVPPDETTGGGGETTASRLPDSLDVSELDADDRALLEQVLAEQFDPCGKPRSFLESLGDRDTCALAPLLGAMAAQLVSQGLPKREIAQRLKQEQARRRAKAEFDLEGSPCTGDPKSAKHRLVEFSDFQCPFCRMVSEPLEKMARERGAVLCIKLLPLAIPGHDYSRPAAAAALAAKNQGHYWEVARALYANQHELDNKKIRELVKAAGVDMERFDRDLAGTEIRKLLIRDTKEADMFGVEGTPTIFLDGYMVEFTDLEAKLSEKNDDSSP